MASAASPEAPLVEKMCTVPSSRTSILTPVCSAKALIFFPPGPLRSRILFVGIFSVERRRRRRTVGLQNVGNQAHGGGKVRCGRKQIQERAMGESAMPNFAATGAAQEFHFADAERREVIVQHETIELILLEEQVETLHVF